MTSAVHTLPPAAAPAAAPATIAGSPRLGRLATPLWWLTVAVLAAVSIQHALTTDFASDGATRAALVALGLVVIAALPAGRRWPASALVAMYVVALVQVAVTPADPSAVVTLAAPLGAYAAGRRAETRALRIGGGLALVLWVVIRAASEAPSASVGSIASVAAFFIVAPIVVGRGVRDRERLRDVLEARAAAEEADRLESAGRAQLDERARIAGELHDVVAHALSAMVIQAGGARLQTERDAAKAADAFAAVERTGRDALYEIRSLLGVLREAGATDELLEPQPSLDHLPALVARAGRSGLQTVLRVEGEPRPLPAGPSLAAYRAVQDALRAAREEGAARSAEVELHYEEAGIHLVVRDDGAATRAPLPVRERVVLYGGTFTAAQAGSGHRVDLRLRTERAA